MRQDSKKININNGGTNFALKRITKYAYLSKLTRTKLQYTTNTTYLHYTQLNLKL